jgi:hypothetical protein
MSFHSSNKPPLNNVFSNEKIENKYHQIFNNKSISSSNEIHITQIHQCKQECKKKHQQICQFQYPKLAMKCTKTLLLLNEKNHIL